MNPASPRIQIDVAYTDPLVAIGLATVLGEQPDMQVRRRWQADLGRDPVDPDAPAADILVADYRQGLQAAEQQRRTPRQALPGTAAAPQRRGRVLVISSSEREYDVRRALDAGVDGYLELGCDLHELVQGVRQLARGSRYLSSAAASRMADSLHRTALTPRELQVLQLLAQGQSNKAIALALTVTLGTVKAHLKTVMNKLDAASRTEAASIALARGLVASPQHT